MRSPLLILALSWSLPAAGEGYLRYPDLHGDQVVFTAEGDLWTSAASGGTARRLTRSEGTERHAHFSPDGETLAFTGEYDGNRDVFVMSASGGEPRRLTWHPATDEVVGWTPGGDVIFRSNRHQPHRRTELYTVSLKDEAITPVGMGWAGRLAIDPKSGAWAFNRLVREHRTWKRYRGGTAQDLWVGDPKKKDFKRITDFDGTDAFPMWHDGRVWFLSDQGGTVNLWSVAPDGSDREAHTDLGDMDARWPEISPDGRIVFMLGGDIHLFDPATGSHAKIDIDLPSDRPLTRDRHPDPGDYLSWASISPSGDRVLYVTRGEVFSVPVEPGVTLPLTAGSAARESWANFDHDGARVLMVTDASGEEGIVSVDAWGRGEARTIKEAGERGWHLPPLASPDGARVAWGDDDYGLWVARADGKGKPKRIDRAEQFEITQYAWSPDGRWLAYVKLNSQDFRSIWLHDTETGENHQVTGAMTDDHSPAWDPDGEYLYFIGERYINPLLGNRDFEYITDRSSQLYVVPLRPDVENPVLDDAGLPPADEDSGKGNKKKKDKKKDKEDEEETELAIEIAFEGIDERAVKLPVGAGTYVQLSATADRLFYLSLPTKGMAEWGSWLSEGEPENTLMSVELEEMEAEEFAPGVGGYELAAEGEKLLVLRGGGSLAVIGTGGPANGEALSEGAVDVSGVSLSLDTRDEWRQIFWEGWRHMRDFHWDQEMTGLDWEAIGERYAKLLPRLSTRDDLRDLMGELIGELATSHTYVWGGDYHGLHGDRVSVGLLGADVTPAKRGFEVTRIYQGDPADEVVSPLRVPGVDVSEGDYILAVNNRPLDPKTNFYAAFEGMTDGPVMLTVNDRPSLSGARQVVVTPIGNELKVRYADWVRGKREYVAEKTDGKIAYVHIPDMGARGLITFETWFTPQLGAEGMVVDARFNGGGFVSQLVLERLRRRITSVDRSKGGGTWTYPARALSGPFVVLTNEHAGSDGDIFPAAVQAEGLAPVIGTRSWGGVVGIRANKRLVDGGVLTQPEFAFYWLDREDGWGIENHGVDPDIVVENLPQDLMRGADPQLDRAIEEVLRLRAETPLRRVEEFSPAPDKSRDAFKDE